MKKNLFWMLWKKYGTELSEEEQKLLYEEGTKSLIRKTNAVLLSSGWIDKNIWTDSDSITPIRTLDKVA